MARTTDAITDSLVRSFEAAEEHPRPYRHWFLTSCLPDDAAEEITHLPFPAPALGGISGKREIHNATRKYFDIENRGRYPVVEAFAQAFQSPKVTRRVESLFGTRLGGTYLRLEYAQDTNGFWLEPHTDLGVKVFTMLLYLSKEASHADLGTDIYDAGKHHLGRSPFVPNGAMVFVPSTDTFHGFEPRPIEGVRKSVIINYVTPEWRAREQLSFPDAPIAA
ncbi:MAG: 2OG-Fe(II) oxygenase [Hyphomicrobiaceae bacterium]